MRTAILIASGEAMLSLHPTTDVERKLVDIMSGEVDVSLHHTTWCGTIGGVHRQFQGLGGELIVVVKPKAEPRTEDRAAAKPTQEPRDYANPDNPLNSVRGAIWGYATAFQSRTPLQASYDLDEVMAKVAGLLGTRPFVPRTDAPTTAYPTKDDIVDLLKDYVDGATSLAAQAVLQRFPKLPSPNAVLNVVAGANTLPEKVTRIFALFAGEADPAPGPRTTTPDSRDRQVDLLAHDVYRSVLESREHDLAAAELNYRKTTHMHSTEIVEYARKAAADAAKATVLRWRDVLKTDLSPLNLDGKAEDPEPDAAVLQLRRDVKWLEDRGCQGQESLLPHTLAEMVGLDATEFVTLTLKTRQKFENRAYTALRALNYLNSGAKK